MPARMGYRPALDGVRAVAIAGVLAFHAGYARAGSLGVTVFFALSGFLITTLLLEERAEHGRVDLRAFYLRRVYRLYPALVLSLAATMALTLAHRPPVDDHMWLAYPAALFYCANLVPILTVPHALGSIVWTWSLAVEEQFYLVWPVVCRWLPRARTGRSPLPSLRHLAAVAAGLVVLSLVLRTFVYSAHAGDPRMYFGTLSRMNALLIGCLGAVWRLRQLRADRFSVRLPGWTAAGALAVVVVGYGLRERLIWQEPLVAVATTLLLLALTEDGRTAVARLLSWRPVVHVGKISYGVYLYQLMCVVLYGHLVHRRPHGWWTFGWVALTLAVAEVSYQLVERPLLRRAPRPGRRRSASRTYGGVPAHHPAVARG